MNLKILQFSRNKSVYIEDTQKYINYIATFNICSLPFNFSLVKSSSNSCMICDRISEKEIRKLYGTDTQTNLCICI